MDLKELKDRIDELYKLYGEKDVVVDCYESSSGMEFYRNIHAIGIRTSEDNQTEFIVKT